ncbi:hypothetical protein [Nocardioides mesophilus]|uniref:Uncharacterized protein n=1 Tax=Nocardioides mesophilus TaxID=433659 RepID=A0A7G9RDA2_9ACTN|nr:hypothetical protein [Nocardioides mesophilus]QNN53577.1 hypothetical protein H9L09_03880 [Nocardioides mesophilus]
MTQGPAAPQPSSDKLKTDVANFMERADEIVEHPLAQGDPQFEVLLRFDPETALVTHGSLELKNADKQSWLYLALLMRPVVFTQDDPTSYANLTGAIAREHEPLRDVLKSGRKAFVAWQKHMFVGQQDLGSVPEHLQGQEPGSLVYFSLEEIDEVGPEPLPAPIDVEKMVPDSVYANIYFNGHVWHSDTEKAARYQTATPLMKAYYAKCAEIRTITAVRFVRDLRRFIIETRVLGFDY